MEFKEPTGLSVRISPILANAAAVIHPFNLEIKETYMNKKFKQTYPLLSIISVVLLVLCFIGRRIQKTVKNILI